MVYLLEFNETKMSWQWNNRIVLMFSIKIFFEDYIFIFFRTHDSNNVKSFSETKEISLNLMLPIDDLKRLYDSVGYWKVHFQEGILGVNRYW